MARNKRQNKLRALNLERLLDMAYGRWKITAPPTIDPDIIEPILVEAGAGCFYDAPVLGWVFGRMVPQGLRDANGDPEQVDIILKNGVTLSRIAFADVIPVYNNARRAPSLAQIDDYAQRLARLQLTIDTNIALRKFPGFVACEQREQGTIKNLLNNWAGDDFVIFGRKGLNPRDLLQYIDFGVPDVATPTDMLRNRAEQEALAYLGIDSSPSEKGAQVGMAEVVSNMGKAYAMRLNYQQARDRASELAAARGVTIEWEWQGLRTAEVFQDMSDDEPNEEPDEHGEEVSE